MMSADVGSRFSEPHFPRRRSLYLPAAVCKKCNIGGYEGFSVMCFYKIKSETFLYE